MRGRTRFAAGSVVYRGMMLLLLALVTWSVSGFTLSVSVPKLSSNKVTVKIAKGRMGTGDEVVFNYKVNSSVYVPCTSDSTQSNSSYDAYACLMRNSDNSPHTATFNGFYIQNGITSWIPETTYDSSTQTFTNAASQDWGRPSKPISKVVVAGAEPVASDSSKMAITLKLRDEDGNPVTGRPYLDVSRIGATFYDDDGDAHPDQLLTHGIDDTLAFVATYSAWNSEPATGRLLKISYSPSYGGLRAESAYNTTSGEITTPTMTDALAEDLANPIVYDGLDDSNRVTGDLQLKTLGEYGSAISWTSNPPDAVSADGHIARPPVGSSDQNVMLTASAAYQGNVRPAYFSVKVKPAIVIPSDGNLAAGMSPLESPADTAATDGDPSTAWTDPNGDQTFTLDFGEDRTIKKWSVSHFSESNYLQVFKFQTSEDGLGWTDQDIFRHNAETETSRELAAPVEARYARLSVVSASVTPVQIREFEVWGVQPNLAPTAGDVSVTGKAKIGETLTGSYTYADADDDAEGGTTFQWYAADDAAGTNKTAIAGATSKTFVPTARQAGKFVTFAVTPVAAAGVTAGASVESAAVGPIGDMKGDANGDGLVTPADALIVNKYVQGTIQLTDEQLMALDMDDDGDVDADDARIILNIYLGKGV